MTGYEAFCVYHALKLHFTTPSYDYFKYGGKVNVSVDAFDNRKDKYYFHKIARNYSKDELVDFFVANFLVNPTVWIGKLMEDEAHNTYLQYIKIIQSLSYNFENDCRNMFVDVDNPNDIIKTTGEHPTLLKKAMRNEISIQTLLILNSLLNFLPMWRKNITDTIIWPDYDKKLKKYSQFLVVDNMKYKLILKKCIN